MQYSFIIHSPEKDSNAGVSGVEFQRLRSIVPQEFL